MSRPSKVIPREELYRAEILLRYAIHGLEFLLPILEHRMRYETPEEIVKATSDNMKSHIDQIKEAYDLIKRWIP
jgi:hypothetical protein